MSDKKAPPVGYSEVEWRNLRHDVLQCIKSMENMSTLILQKELSPQEVAEELKLMAEQTRNIYTTLFEEKEIR